jgi:uncharacterized membrane protein YeaQ/YmgE (transglycosylase-associated protein family)
LRQKDEVPPGSGGLLYLGRGTKNGIHCILILGLIAGAIAKAILPGRQGGGWVITLVLGVVGALLGGWIGGMIFGTGLQEFFSLQTWLLAIGGALIVLLVYGMVTKRGARS